MKKIYLDKVWWFYFIKMANHFASGFDSVFVFRESNKEYILQDNDSLLWQ